MIGGRATLPPWCVVAGRDKNHLHDENLAPFILRPLAPRRTAPLARLRCGTGRRVINRSSMTTKTKLWIAVGLGLVAVVGVLVGVKAMQIGTMIKAGKAFVPPSEAVTSVQVEATLWQPIQSASGTLVAFRGVTVGSELPGAIREVSFDSGTSVKKGAILVKLDSSTEEAQLAAARADENLARLNYERAVEVRKGQANTPADLDAADARYKQAQAAVNTLKTTIDKKSIRAPFDGRIAIRQVELGQVLGAGAPVASLQSVTPIYVEFSLPQQALARLKVGQPVRMKTDTFPDSTWDGKVSTINTEVDIATRNVRVRATVPNDDGRLRPGMFANVEVISPEKRPGPDRAGHRGDLRSLRRLDLRPREEDGTGRQGRARGAAALRPPRRAARRPGRRRVRARRPARRW